MLGTNLTQLKSYWSNWNIIYKIGTKYVVYPYIFYFVTSIAMLDLNLSSPNSKTSS